MLSALYYPHTEIRNHTIIKNALLLWDHIETIVPRGPTIPREGSQSRTLREASDLIVRPRQPTQRESFEAHRVLEDLMRSGRLAVLLSKSPSKWQDQRYLIFPDKFLAQTWRMLERNGLAHLEARHDDYGVPLALGFLMMSLLADSCAGTQVQKITDRVDAYSWLTEVFASSAGTSIVRGLDISQVAPAYDRLVTISLEALDARSIPLQKLLAFRKREAKSGSTDYANMRRRYLATLDAHIKRVVNEAKSRSDLVELERQFRNEIRADVSDLRSELGLVSRKALFSKEVAFSTIATGGALIAPIPGLTALATQIGLIGIVPLLKAAVELRGARGTALLKHNSSWLYLASKGRVQIV